MNRFEVVRWLALVLPVAALALAARTGDRGTREAGALLLSWLAAMLGLAVLHEVATAAGWWRYADVTGAFRGNPVDLWIGWAILWGPLPVALRRHVGPVTAMLGALWLDVVAMPLATPVVELGPDWLRGELLGLAIVLAPAVALGRWVADDRRLTARVILQAVLAGGLVLWLLPTAAFSLGDGSWSTLVDRPWWQLAGIAQLAAVVGLPALAAVHELVVRGGGSPFPWDPTRRLVTSGPYAYVAAPMQLSAVALLALLAAATSSWSLAGAAAAGVAFNVTIAAPHEHEALTRRFGPAYLAYRRAVRTWRPRWRPYVPVPATLWLARDCDLCQQLAEVVLTLGPVALDRADAEDHPNALVRARYEAADGTGDDGLAAVARSLEHVNLAAAAVGWAVRIPGLRTVLQLVADGVGAGPRELSTSHDSIDHIDRTEATTEEAA